MLIPIFSMFIWSLGVGFFIEMTSTLINYLKNCLQLNMYNGHAFLMGQSVVNLFQA